MWQNSVVPHVAKPRSCSYLHLLLLQGYLWCVIVTRTSVRCLERLATPIKCVVPHTLNATLVDNVFTIQFNQRKNFQSNGLHEHSFSQKFDFPSAFRSRITKQQIYPALVSHLVAPLLQCVVAGVLAIPVAAGLPSLHSSQSFEIVFAKCIGMLGGFWYSRHIRLGISKGSLQI